MTIANSTAKPFMGWRDLVITPLVWLFSLAVPMAFASWLVARYAWDSFAWFAIFVTSTIGFTLLIIAFIVRAWPPKAGHYTSAADPWPVYVWNLISFLCITNLSFQYMSGLIPPPFRKLFYGMLGAKMGGGVISIGGRITDPYLVTVEENAMIGDDSLILAHAVIPGGRLILAPVHIKAGAVVGARSVVMPGVVIGENATVKAMSLVTMNTEIPANEVWAGIPARKT